MFSVLSRSLNRNELTNDGKDMSGILKLAEALPHSQLTSLRWPTSSLNLAWTLCLCLPLRQQPCSSYHPLLPSPSSLLSNQIGHSYNKEAKEALQKAAGKRIKLSLEFPQS